MLKSAVFYAAVFVVGTTTMVLADKLGPQKFTQNHETITFEKRLLGSGSIPALKIRNMSPAESHDI